MTEGPSCPCRLTLGTGFPALSGPLVTLWEMKLKTSGAKCSTGGTRAVPGPERPAAHSWRQARCSFEHWGRRRGWEQHSPLLGPWPIPGFQVHWQDSGWKCFCLLEGLSGGLEPEGGHWVARHSWLGGERQWAGSGGLSRAPALGVNSLTHHGGLHRRRSVSPAWQYGP